MEPNVQGTTIPSILTPWIACLTCHSRAYRVSNWRPGIGINPLMRKFVCKDGHESYKVFTQAELDKLTV
ncbi:unnamed protein product [marine sediment metagenome]|uniref:Uncharacterized protein n=1 Tax=marine sediment metagenome TaxID=412755 RepID=X1NEG4_9ZZZZ